MGMMGRTHAAAYARAAREGLPCTLKFFSDPAIDRIDTAEFAPARTAAHVAELLADPAVHLVSICTPTDTHIELALRALAAGKHVLLEKPVSLRSGDARHLAHAARESGRLVMPAMCVRFWPGWSHLRAMIRDRRYGGLRSLHIDRHAPPPAWNAFYADESRSGGAIVDLHIHDTDFVWWVLGGPASVCTTGWAACSTTTFTFPDGPHVRASAGWTHTPTLGFRMRFSACFELATVEYDCTPSRGPATLSVFHAGGSDTIDLGTLTGYDEQVRHMIGVVARGGGEGDLAATLDQAAEVLAINEAERLSLRTGLPVRVS
jgi:predicted dehydrogenase